jgi:hypothetical protein
VIYLAIFLWVLLALRRFGSGEITLERKVSPSAATPGESTHPP